MPLTKLNKAVREQKVSTTLVALQDAITEMQRLERQDMPQLAAGMRRTLEMLGFPLPDKQKPMGI